MEQQIKEFDSLTELLEDLEREGITGKKKKQIINHFMMMKARKAGIPFTGSFELTPLCNLDCKMCYMHLTKAQADQAGKILSTQEWLSIIRRAVDAGMMRAELTGGECLIHPGFKEIYEYLFSRGVNVSIMTNGRLLTDEMVAFLSRYRPEMMQISVYGSNPEAYLKVTGHDAFQEVIGGIKRAKEAGIKISLVVTPSRYMREDALHLLKLVRSFGVEYGVSGVTLPARPETERDILDYIADRQLMLDIDREEKRYAEEVGEAVSSERKPYVFKLKQEIPLEGFPCSAGSSAFHINWKGEMTPCVPFHNVAKSVVNDDFNLVWKWLRQKVREYRRPEECNTCKLQNICKACPAEKTSGVFNGALNRMVCEKWNGLIEAGVLTVE